MILAFGMPALAAMTMHGTQALAQSGGSLVIGGRPEAPLIGPQQLPFPNLPQPRELHPFEEIDATDFIRNPELFLIDPNTHFALSLKELKNEVEALESQRLQQKPGVPTNLKGTHGTR